MAGHLTNQEFEGVCSALTQAIADVLRRMRRLREARQPTPAPRRTIFVGDATRDVRDLRDSVVKELEDRGCLVLRPEIGVDDGIEAITAAIASKAALADVAVHILGRSTARFPKAAASRSSRCRLGSSRRRQPSVPWIVRSRRSSGSRKA